MARHRAAGALFGVRRRVGRRRIGRRVLLRRHARARALDRRGSHRRAHLRGAAAQRVSVPSEAQKRLQARARARAGKWRGGLVCTNGARAAKRAHRGQPAGHDHARYDWNRKSAQRCAVRAAWGVSRRRAQTLMRPRRDSTRRANATTRRGRTLEQSSAVQHARCSAWRDATPVRAGWQSLRLSADSPESGGTPSAPRPATFRAETLSQAARVKRLRKASWSAGERTTVIRQRWAFLERTAGEGAAASTAA